MPILVWFRRDFRIHDNTALYHAVRDSADGIVIPLFIFDDAILKHSDTGAAIVHFMIGCLENLRDNFAKDGVDMLFVHGKPLDQLRAVAKQTGASAVYFNKDYHPAAIERDDEVRQHLPQHGIEVRAFKDQVVFEERELLAASTKEAYTVYTPYSKSWRARLAQEYGPKKGPPTWDKPRLAPWKSAVKSTGGANVVDLYSPAQLGFADGPAIEVAAGEDAARKMLKAWCARPIKSYKESRNFPADEKGTSRLSAHLRHGTLSARQCVRAAMYVAGESAAFKTGADTWVGELIWREFYQQILFNFPNVVDHPFKKKFAGLQWEYDKGAFKKWCDGQTGYPIVDAAMRQLNATGWMHNRLRMIVAMFLTKDLRIDYRWGERYFMQKLIDGETAQNNGGWQWSSSTGTDAQPYFRIFNPASQSEKFDEKGVFIRRYVPELNGVVDDFIHSPSQMTPLQQAQSQCVIGRDYPPPIVDHSDARQQTLAMFKG